MAAPPPRSERPSAAEPHADLKVNALTVEEQTFIDEMVMDFLLYVGARRLLDWRRAELDGQMLPEGRNPDYHLAIVDSYLQIFRARHPRPTSALSLPNQGEMTMQLRWRLRLLTHLTLFTQRLAPTSSTPPLKALMRLRARNDERAKESDCVNLPDDLVSAMEKCKESRELPLEWSRTVGNREFVLEQLRPRPKVQPDMPQKRAKKNESRAGKEVTNEDDVFIKVEDDSNNEELYAEPTPPDEGQPESMNKPHAQHIDFYGSPNAPSLLDLFPSFIALSARFYANQYTRHALPHRIDPDAEKFRASWFALAAEWSLQAVLEAYLICSKSGQDILWEVFSWGDGRDDFSPSSTADPSPKAPLTDEEKAERDAIAALFAAPLDPNDVGRSGSPSQSQSKSQFKLASATNTTTTPTTTTTTTKRKPSSKALANAKAKAKTDNEQRTLNGISKRWLGARAATLKMLTPPSPSSPPSDSSSSDPDSEPDDVPAATTTTSSSTSPSGPAERGNFVAHLRNVALAHPAAPFESRVLDFLETVHRAGRREHRPLLVQMEEGRVAGLTREETERFKVEVGWGRGISGIGLP